MIKRSSLAPSQISVNDTLVCLNNQLVHGLSGSKFIELYTEAAKRGNVSLLFQSHRPFSEIERSPWKQKSGTEGSLPAPPVYVLNLDRREARWALFSQQCEQAGVVCRRFSAVDGKTHELTGEEKWNFRNVEYQLLRGQGVVGCA